MSSQALDSKNSDISNDSGLTAGPFFVTTEQRIALARERFFEDGIRPSGLVPEHVVQSWTRCVGARRKPREGLALEPVTKARIETALARNRLLLEVAREDVLQLDTLLAGTAYKAMLLSHDGVIVHATPIERREGALLPHVARVGVDLGEANIGTGAPNVAARSGKVCVVRGAEHFFDGMSKMYCAAAPIRDSRGNVVGALDISSEGEMFKFDAASLVMLYATTIENRLLEAQSRNKLLLRFQASPALIRTPLEGLACIAEEGRVLWLNQTGANFLGCDRVPTHAPCAEEMFGLSVDSLMSFGNFQSAMPHRLPSGITLWMEVRREASGKTPAEQDLESLSMSPAEEEVSSAAPVPAPKLHDVNRALIESKFFECKGNVAKTARELGVSRGLMYRRLRDWGLTRD